jgi:hypothetical protein
MLFRDITCRSVGTMTGCHSHSLSEMRLLLLLLAVDVVGIHIILLM